MKLKLTTVAFIALSHLTLLGQEIRLKGMFFPILEHSVAVEALLNQNLSFQLTYQNHNEWGDNMYYHHRIIPSVRYYHTSDNKVLNLIYAEVFYRRAFIKHHVDQRDNLILKYKTNSLGLSIGKQLKFTDKFFMDFSFGHYYIYSDNEKNDYSDFYFFNYQERHRWRVDIKLGLILTNQNK